MSGMTLMHKTLKNKPMEMQMFNCNHKVKQIITKSYTVHVTFNCFFFSVAYLFHYFKDSRET